MSDTPRTDEQSNCCRGNDMVEKSFACQLERELNAALAKITELEKCLAKFHELVRMLADLYNDKRG